MSIADVHNVDLIFLGNQDVRVDRDVEVTVACRRCLAFENGGLSEDNGIVDYVSVISIVSIFVYGLCQTYGDFNEIIAFENGVFVCLSIKLDLPCLIDNNFSGEV